VPGHLFVFETRRLTGKDKNLMREKNSMEKESIRTLTRIWFAFVMVTGLLFGNPAFAQDDVLQRLNGLEKRLSELKLSQQTALENQKNTVEEIKNLKIWVNKRRGGGVVTQQTQSGGQIQP